MEKQARHRPHREYSDAKRLILEPDIESCPICGQALKARRNWHSRKTIQTLNGPLFVAGKTKECVNLTCRNYQKRYYAGRVWLYSLPGSTYGLDVLAWIGWQHEHEHRQMVEIQRLLNQRGVAVNERNVGKLYRQFLALLSATSENARGSLEQTAREYGGLIWAVDALQPEGPCGLLYVLYEVLSGKPVAALQGERIDQSDLENWLRPYQTLQLPVLATLSDGERTLAAAFKTCWPEAPHQRCRVHFLNNLAEEVLDYEDELRQNIRQNLGGLPKVPTEQRPETDPPFSTKPTPTEIPS